MGVRTCIWMSGLVLRVSRLVFGCLDLCLDVWTCIWMSGLVFGCLDLYLKCLGCLD